MTSGGTTRTDGIATAIEIAAGTATTVTVTVIVIVIATVIEAVGGARIRIGAGIAGEIVITTRIEAETGIGIGTAITTIVAVVAAVDMTLTRRGWVAVGRGERC